MKRIWQVEEQIIEDPATKLRLELSSVHTDEINAGNEAPAHDEIVVLRLWTSDRERIATFAFERNGRFIKTDVEPAASILHTAPSVPASVHQSQEPCLPASDSCDKP